MTVIKTVISVQRCLLERAEAVARQLHISRSQLLARALGEFLDRHENRTLLEGINRSLEEEAGSEETQSVRRMRGIQRRRVEGQR